MKSRELFRNSDLILFGHGSTVNERSSEPVFRHSEKLRNRCLFRSVSPAFWKEPPLLAEVVRQSAAPHLFLIPFFVSEGYFTQEAVPRELGFLGPDALPEQRVFQMRNQTVHYCPALGTHPRITEILLSRAAHIIEQHPFPAKPNLTETALFLAGHGTPKNENNRKQVEKRAQEIRALGRYAEVHSIFIEEDPRIGHCFQLSQARNFIVVPYFMSDGMHVAEDIPVMLGDPESLVQSRLKSGKPTWRNPTEKKGRLIWYSPAVGSDPSLSDLIVEMLEET